MSHSEPYSLVEHVPSVYIDKLLELAHCAPVARPHLRVQELAKGQLSPGSDGSGSIGCAVSIHRSSMMLYKMLLNLLRSRQWNFSYESVDPLKKFKALNKKRRKPSNMIIRKIWSVNPKHSKIMDINGYKWIYWYTIFWRYKYIKYASAFDSLRAGWLVRCNGLSRPAAAPRNSTHRRRSSERKCRPQPTTTWRATMGGTERCKESPENSTKNWRWNRIITWKCNCGETARTVN